MMRSLARTGRLDARWAPALLCAALAACGGGYGGGGGAAPTPTVTGITINGPAGPYIVAETYTFSATVTLSNGQTQAASGSWGGDAPTVGTMANGVFTGVGPGEVTIWIDVTQGGRATKRLRVHPSYNATWVGSYRVTSCVDSGQVRSGRFCRDFFTPGTMLPLGLFMSQNGLTVESTVYLGQLEMPRTTSTVGDDGRLQVDSRLTDEDFTVEATLRLHQPTTLSVGGTIAETWTISGLSGTGKATGDLVDVVKQAAVASPSFAAPARSLEDWLRAATR